MQLPINLISIILLNNILEVEFYYYKKKTFMIMYYFINIDFINNISLCF